MPVQVNGRSRAITSFSWTFQVFNNSIGLSLGFFSPAVVSEGSIK